MFKILKADKRFKQSQLKEVCRCHKESFPKALSTSLGNRFLMKNYSWYFEHPDVFLLFAQSKKGEILGYAGGMLKHSKSAEGSSSSLIQYAFKEAVLAFLLRPWLLFHSETRRNYRLIFSNIKRKLFSKKRHMFSLAVDQKETISLGLVVIGTVKSARGKGLGSALLKSFEKTGVDMKVKQLHLSVKKSNSKAIQAYTRNGWKVCGEQGENLQMCKNL